MREITVLFSENKRVSAVVEGHIVTTDQPKEQGGEGQHPDPFSLFLASLATCAGFYVQSFCAARNIPMDGIALLQEAVFDGEKTLSRISLTLTLPSSFPAKHLSGIRRAAESCKVKKALAAAPTISVAARYDRPGELGAAV